MAERPGWGPRHVHDWREIAKIGQIVVEKCLCGQKRYVQTLMTVLDPENEEKP